MRTDIEYVRSLESRLEELRDAADQADVEYRDEIARLREEKAADWKAACESTRLASTEIDRLRLRLRFADAVIRSGDVAALTDAEREAVEWAALALENWAEERNHAGNVSKRLHKTAATLRKLLKRLSPPAT